MRPRRRFIPGEAYFISARTAQGLPFAPQKAVQKIIKGILAKGQSLYPTPICHYLFMGNHFHLIVVCKKSKTLVYFYKYIKAELARAMNKLAGKRGVMWQGRCDAPVLLTAEDVMEKSAYLYSNPQAAHLVERVEHWPGANSWEAFVTGRHVEKCEWIPVRELTSEGIRNLEEYREYRLEISPFAWLESKDYQDVTQRRAKGEIIRRVREAELRLCGERRAEGRGVVGRRTLEEQGIYRQHRPKKYGRRVYCICHDPVMRQAYIEEYLEFVAVCRATHRKWSRGDFSVEYPPGAFPAPLIELAV